MAGFRGHRWRDHESEHFAVQRVYDLRLGAIEIAKLLRDKPLSVEVVTDDREEMYTQAVEMAGWAPNIVVKIPIITTQGEPCLGNRQANPSWR